MTTHNHLTSWTEQNSAIYWESNDNSQLIYLKCILFNISLPMKTNCYDGKCHILHL